MVKVLLVIECTPSVNWLVWPSVDLEWPCVLVLRSKPIVCVPAIHSKLIHGVWLRGYQYLLIISKICRYRIFENAKLHGVEPIQVEQATWQESQVVSYEDEGNKQNNAQIWSVCVPFNGRGQSVAHRAPPLTNLCTRADV